MPDWDPSNLRKHVYILLLFTVISHIISYLVLFSCTFLPLFDSSPKTITQSRWASPLLRWDAFHFAHIAENGYVYEHEWAFLPGLPTLMRFAAKVISPADGITWDNLLKAGALAALACDTTNALYHLSLHHLGSPHLAFLASLLSLLPSSPATLRVAAYNEPFFTYLSYRGMLRCAKAQWLLASLMFTVAATFRSNGVLLGGFILWGMVVEPLLNGNKPSAKTVLYSTLLTTMILTPFILHNYSAYIAFCTTPHPASWCSNFPPSIYAHVQRTYWDVGFLRYWTLRQLPNFIISAPPLILLFSFSIYHITHALVPRVLSALIPATLVLKQSKSPFLSPMLTPHAIHALILSMSVLVAAHTQIILRLAPSMPIIYWAAAWLFVERPTWRGRKKPIARGSTWGKWWVGWSTVWGAVSLILWGTFLPPA